MRKTYQLSYHCNIFIIYTLDLIIFMQSLSVTRKIKAESEVGHNGGCAQSFRQGMVQCYSPHVIPCLAGTLEISHFVLDFLCLWKDIQVFLIIVEVSQIHDEVDEGSYLVDLLILMFWIGSKITDCLLVPCSRGGIPLQKLRSPLAMVSTFCAAQNI